MNDDNNGEFEFKCKKENFVNDVIAIEYLEA